MAPGANNKWSDAAIKDLIFAILMSNGDGNFSVNANWDNVLITMNKWGYGFTKSAMSQQWTKKILKEFKERHAEGADTASVTASASTTSTPRGKKGGRAAGTPKTPKTPASGKGKGKRSAEDDDDEDNDTPPERTNNNSYPITYNRTPRASASSKKIKYEEEPEVNEAGEPIEDGHPYLTSDTTYTKGEPDEDFERI